MIVPFQFSALTDDELLRLVMTFSDDKRSTLETELAKRLGLAVDKLSADGEHPGS